MEGRGERRDWFGEPDRDLESQPDPTGEIVKPDAFEEADRDNELDQKKKPKTDNPDLNLL